MKVGWWDAAKRSWKEQKNVLQTFVSSREIHADFDNLCKGFTTTA